jgi:hypothetical protein
MIRKYIAVNAGNINYYSMAAIDYSAEIVFLERIVQ